MGRSHIIMYLFPELFGTSHVKCNFSTAPPSGILLFPGYFHDISSPPFGSYRIFTCYFVWFKKLSTSNFHDISRIFTWFWQSPFWDLQDIDMFLVRFRKPSTSNFHDISRIFPGYLHGSGSPPFGIYRIFTCFSYGRQSHLLNQIFMLFTCYLHLFLEKFTCYLQ